MSFRDDVAATADNLRKEAAQKRAEEEARDRVLKETTDALSPVVASVLNEFATEVWGPNGFRIEHDRQTAAGYWDLVPRVNPDLDAFQVYTYSHMADWESPATVIFRARTKRPAEELAQTTKATITALQAMLHGLLLEEEQRVGRPHMDEVVFAADRAFPWLQPSAPTDAGRRGVGCLPVVAAATAIWSWFLLT